MSKREQIQKMLESEPDDIFLRYALAMTYVTEGNAPEAVAHMDQVLALDSDYVAAYFQKGQMLSQQNEIEPAREAIEAGIAAARRTGDRHAEEEMTGYLDSL